MILEARTLGHGPAMSVFWQKGGRAKQNTSIWRRSLFFGARCQFCGICFGERNLFLGKGHELRRQARNGHSPATEAWCQPSLRIDLFSELPTKYSGFWCAMSLENALVSPHFSWSRFSHLGLAWDIILAASKWKCNHAFLVLRKCVAALVIDYCKPEVKHFRDPGWRSVPLCSI